MGTTSIKFDKKRVAGYCGLVGVDEVGRGALAGPVVASSAYISGDFYASTKRWKEYSTIKDSKELTAAKREEAFNRIQSWIQEGILYVSTAQASVEEIEHLNILGATRLAMERALVGLIADVSKDEINLSWGALVLGDLFKDQDQINCVRILIDGKPLKPFPYAHDGIVAGDSKSFVIGIASIVAKVIRDRMLVELDQQYDAYGLAQNKGYGTVQHREALLANGPSLIHRPSFLEKIFSKSQAKGTTDLLC